MTEEKKKEKSKDRFEIVEVPTQTTELVRDLKEDKVLGDKEVITEILNKLDKIEKAVA